MAQNNIKLFYSNSNNFGDAINPIIFERLTGKKFIHSNRYKASFAGIGSIMHHLTKSRTFGNIYNHVAPTINIWGSGFKKDKKHPNEQESFHHRKVNILALRGKLTQKRVEDILKQKLPQDLILGDGGILFNLLLDKPIIKKNAIGIIPHTADLGDPIFDKIAENIKNSKIINLREDPLDILKSIAECDFIMSTAMHGLIAADSLGIPNKWLEVSDKVDGKGYKFRDYYSAYKDYSQTAYRINESNANTITPQKIQEWASSYNLTTKEVDILREKLYKKLKNCIEEYY